MVIHFPSLNRLTTHWYTLHAQTFLITDLHAEGFIFVIHRRFQSDPLENPFAQYRHISGGRFLVNLRKVKSSAKILLTWSLIKESINFMEEKIQSKKSISSEFIQKIADQDYELQWVGFAKDSTEVAYTIAGMQQKN